ncbi:MULTISPECIES: addiction module protein [unclassified Neptuniibacter]|uniref:addiction module protein n=1 Tax=unclassified Neptuniibacter TaxID=2630693 RepID=UPI000C56AE3E|nr:MULTISPECIES: addiction module protein [unclassified Neptuniibacter]MAY43298.1 addiction module antitoxin RelB [Oceanospirillaceae bacterium]|tara:strand:- start:745 stop:963 length:219 start_codon:yes stop_codon:yes gene_type:complete
MSAAFKRVIGEIDSLSAKEKALVAHRLIESLDSVEDEGTEQAWKYIAEQRYNALLSGDVTAISWDEIKQQVK